MAIIVIKKVINAEAANHRAEWISYLEVLSLWLEEVGLSQEASHLQEVVWQLEDPDDHHVVVEFHLPAMAAESAWLPDPPPVWEE